MATTPEYVALQKCFESVIAVVKIDPGSLCDALFSEGYVPESVRNYTRMDALPDENKARKLIDTVIDQIKEDPNVFHHFLGTLKSSHYDKLKKKLTECYKSERSKTLDDSKAKLQPDTNGTSFLCPYCKNCSLEQYLSEEGCPKATGKTLFPYLNTPNLSEEERTMLEFRLMSATEDLIMLFAETDTYIAENLCADITIVKNFVLDLVRIPNLDENGAKLNKATSIPEIILALQPYKSFLNYEIIERIANKFGTPDICDKMQKYVTAFNDFCKRSAFELPVNVLPKKGNTRSEKILSVKLRKKELASIGDTKFAQLNMAKILGVNPWALKICSIEEGCLCVRFLVPAALMILPFSPDRKSALRDAGIIISEEQIVGETSNR